MTKKEKIWSIHNISITCTIENWQQKTIWKKWFTLFSFHRTHFYPIHIQPIFTQSVSFFSSNFDADWSTNSLCIVGNDKAFITEWTFLMCDDLIIHVSHLGYCLVIIWQIYSDILSLHSESDGEGLKRLTKFEWTEHYSKTFLVINSCSLFFSGLNKKSLLLWKRRMKQFSFPWLCSHNNYQNWQWQHFNIAILTTHHALSHHFRKCQLPLF